MDTRHRAAAFRIMAMAALALVAILGAEGEALAQSFACQQLGQTLAAIERSVQYRNYASRGKDLERLAAALRQETNQYVRGGCQAYEQAGQRLPPLCMALARRILSDRRDYDRLDQSVGAGAGLAQQRQDVIGEMRQQGCDVRTAGGSGRGQSLFDQLFGPYVGGPSSEGNFIEQPYDYGYGSERTIRTLCVRLSDGYYFPISFATLPDYLDADEGECQARCPGAQVELFYYDNPGQDMSQAVNREGETYTSLPSAFKYRKELDPDATCKDMTASTDQQDLTQLDPAATSRPMVAVGGAQFPLPLPDPRLVQRQASPVKVASRNPVGDDDAESAPQPVKPPVATDNSRYVEIAGKKVRIVGPPTPYGRPVAADP